MKKRKHKKKLRVGRIIIAIIILAILGIGGYYGYKLLSKVTEKIIYNDYYLSSASNTIQLYAYDKENNSINKSDTVVYRGTKVKSGKKTITVEETNYIEIILNNTNYYLMAEDIVNDEKLSVKEKEMYVRTSVTVYKNEIDSKIASFIKKGNKLEIVDYDYLDDEGKVNMYKIKKDDIEGWVYRKYLVGNEMDALANYNEAGTYDIHKNRRYSYELYGGKASTLDYYPYEKVSFGNNKLLPTAATIYLNGAVVSNVDSYITLAKNSGINAMVVDIKDGVLAYKSEVAKEYSKIAYDNSLNSFETYQKAIKKIKDAGFYVIGRIVVFNDSHYGANHPEDCIVSNVSYRQWPSAYSRGAWEYNVELAKEAVKEMKFNEIQFDYVRFPEDSYNMSNSGGTDFKNRYKEEKAEAVQNFLFYATDQIHKVEAYLSVDVFGECSNEYVTSYGQYWPAISNIVDAVSSMPYTDHFDRVATRWENPYQTVYNWALGAAARQKEIPTPAIARTWITAYNTPYWNPTVIYDASKIYDQAKALKDAGLTGGFLTWNVSSNLDKYYQIKSALNTNY